MTVQQTVLRVRGMSCGSCVRHIDQALRRLPEVTDVQVDLAAARVRVEHRGASQAALTAAISEAGYAVVS